MFSEAVFILLFRQFLVEETVFRVAQISTAKAIRAADTLMAKGNVSTITAQLGELRLVTIPAINAFVAILAMIDAVTIDAGKRIERQIGIGDTLAVADALREIHIF